MVDTKVLNPEEVLSKIDLNEKLNLLMEDILDPRELVIIQHRFLKLKPSSLKELGDLTGYTRERIRQIQRVALGKLKKHWKQGRL
jgi:RNA polymerase primary sigma factor